MTTRSTFRKTWRVAIAAVASTALITTGVTPAVYAQNDTTTTADTSADNNWGFDEGEKGVVSALGEKLHAPIRGNGTLTAETETVKAGEVLTLNGTGFDKLDGLSVKFGDGRSKYPENAALPQDQDPEYFQNLGTDADPEYVNPGNYAASVTEAHLPGDDGNFQLKIRIPKKIPNGWYWIRVLHPDVSTTAWFKVTDGDASEIAPITTQLEAKGPGKTGLKRHTKDEYQVNYKFVLNNAEPGTELVARATIGNGQDEYPVLFSKRHAPDYEVHTVQSAEDEIGIVVPNDAVKAGKALAFEGHSITLYKKTTGSDGSEKLEAVATKRLPTMPFVAFRDQANMINDSSAGAEVSAIIYNLPNDNVVTGIHAGGSWNKDTKSFDGGTDVYTDDVVVGAAGEDYTAKINFTMPNDASLVHAPLWITVKNANTETAFPTDFSITPNNDDFGADKLEASKYDLKKGLYQSAYSEKEKALFLARTDWEGTGSEVTKLDGKTFKEVATHKVEAYPESYKSGNPDQTRDSYYTFGVGVDDEHGVVWATNTVEDTIALYDSSDLSLIRQFDKGLIKHPRAVLAQPELDAAWVTSPVSKKDTLYFVHGNDLKGDAASAEVRLVETPGFGGAMGLDLSSDGFLYSVSRDEPKVLKLNTKTKAAEVFTLPETALQSGADVALDEKRGNLFVVGQKSNGAAVIDAKTGELKKFIPTGDQALSVSYDKVSDKVFVAHRTAGTVKVIDAETLEPVASVHAGYHPNHTSVDASGRVFVVNKRIQIDSSAPGDELHVLKWKEADEPDPSTTNTPSSTVTPPPATKPGAGSSGNTSSVTSSGDKQGGSSAMPIIGVLAVVAAIVGAVAHAATQGLLPPQLVAMLPPQVRQALHI